jgi:diketogulonate reductase-like aldo/keto reductase
MVNKGKIKSIGLCNFSQSQVQNVLENCEIKPVIAQIVMHPYFQNDLLRNYLEKNNIRVFASAPIADSNFKKFFCHI